MWLGVIEKTQITNMLAQHNKTKNWLSTEELSNDVLQSWRTEIIFCAWWHQSRKWQNVFKSINSTICQTLNLFEAVRATDSSACYWHDKTEELGRKKEKRNMIKNKKIQKCVKVWIYIHIIFKKDLINQLLRELLKLWRKTLNMSQKCYAIQLEYLSLKTYGRPKEK